MTTTQDTSSHALVLSELADLMKQGSEHQRWKQYDEAESFFRQAVALSKERLGEEHEAHGYALSELGALLEERGEQIEARDSFMKALTILEKRLGNQHQDTIWLFGRLYHMFR